MSRNTKSAHTPADGAKAFNIASDMEQKLLKIGKLFSVALLLIEAAEDKQVADAFALIGSTGEDLLDEVKAMRDQIFHLTWGYQHAPEQDPQTPTLRQ